MQFAPDDGDGVRREPVPALLYFAQDLQQAARIGVMAGDHLLHSRGEFDNIRRAHFTFFRALLGALRRVSLAVCARSETFSLRSSGVFLL